MSLRVLAWRVRPYDNGTYLIVDERREALLVDPAMGERETLATIRDEGLKLVEILNTHGHPDHIWANAEIKEATRARLAIHRADAYRLDAAQRPTSLVLDDVPPCEPDDLLDEGPLSFLADIELTALHTPGHTEGSTSFYLPGEGILFSGDVLFQGNVGRVDLPGGDAAAMEESLQRLAQLPPETKVYPGHGQATTIARELPWLRNLRFS